MGRYRVLLEKRAQRQLEKSDENECKRILEALHVLSEEGFSSRLDLKKLKGYENQYRLRVGRYRVLFDLQVERTVIVYAVLPRKQAY